TISGNTAGIDGAGIFNISSSSPVIRNSIIYGNNSGIGNSGSTPVISNSLVQGLPADAVNYNIDGATDPKFISPQAFGLSTAGNYRLQANSPVINQGNNTYFAAM